MPTDLPPFNDPRMVEFAKLIRAGIVLEPKTVAERHALETMVCDLWAKVHGCTVEDARAELARSEANELERYRLKLGDTDPELAKKLFPQPPDETEFPDTPPQR